MITEMQYSAGLMSQSFWFLEFKKVVKLRQSGMDYDDIKKKCIEDNLFGAAKEYRALRMAGYVINRVKTMDEKLIDLFLSSELSTQKVMNLAAILKTDRLYFEFAYEVYREKAILGVGIIEDADGFVEADVQWLVAKLFKDGDIAFYVNSEPVTLLSKTADEIVRFVTRKEYTERLMTEKRERASEKQKKSVREVMKELFGVSSVSDEDDAVMASFLKYADHLKADLEKLEIHYKTQPKYPGKNVVAEGKKLLNDVLQINNSKEFFSEIDQKRDDYFDFAEDYEPVKKFFNGEQLGIFDRAIRLMAIYDDSRTFIVDSAIESAVAQVKDIMKKSSPYGEIFKLPGLLDEYIDAYSNLLTQMEEPILSAIDEASKRVFTDLEGKLCKDKLHNKYLKLFEELREKAKSCNNVATLQNIKVEADALKIRCLNEISAEEAKLQTQRVAEDSVNYGAGQGNSDGSNNSGETPIVKPVVKKRRTVSIKSLNTSATWQVETEADVKKYLADLEKKLLAQLEENTIINIEF